jgi:hypothetical protein
MPRWTQRAVRLRLVDVLVAAGALALGLASLGFGGGPSNYRSTDLLAVVLVVAISAPLAWRCVWPGPVLVLSAGAEVAYALFGYRPGLAWIATVFAVNSFATERSRASPGSKAVRLASRRRSRLAAPTSVSNGPVELLRYSYLSTIVET